MLSPIVTSAWLEDHVNEHDTRIVDIRGKVLPPSEPPPHYFTDRAGYEESHIPNAVFVDWQVDIVEPGSPSNDIASPERFADLMERLGISNDTTVVVYDNAASMFACRLRWALRFYGHEKVHILDGGWTKWLAEGRRVSSTIPRFERGKFEIGLNAMLLATADDILAGVETNTMQLVDVRSPAEYAGESSRAKFGGHIPSAINLPRNTMLAADYTLKPASDLQALFEEAGVDLDAPDTVLYCNSGVSATLGMLALELAGAPNLRIYDGSWKDWGNDPSKPKVSQLRR